ncbi:MAG: cyclic nucleotide-binding domain-containing protein [Myxococcaceae bacterium]|nr:cyclic nucleotide-binding domain-containing protein [Myxococcaceae bacterium]MCI0668846.1 cyclic nucleotide-binding domain-containing protein [Myxococcaceae bacterium]
MATSPLFQQVLQTPLFRGLTELEAAVLFGIADQHPARQGTTLFAEGDAGDALFVVLEGTVEVLKRDSAGLNQALARLGRGSVIGEMSLINQAPRSSSVLAVSDVRLLRIPADRFMRLLGEDNVSALKVVHNLAQTLGRRLASMNDRLVDVLDRGKRREELVEFQRLLSDWSF